MYQPAYGPPRSRDPGLYSRGCSFRDDFRDRDPYGFEAADFNVPGAPPQNHGLAYDYRDYRDRDYRASPRPHDPGLRPDRPPQREMPLFAPNLYSEPRFPPRVPEHEPFRRYRDADYRDLYSQPHFPAPRVAEAAEQTRYSDLHRQGPWSQEVREPWNEGAREHFGARAWGQRFPPDHFEPPVPRYGLRAPEGLSVPGFDLPRQLPSEIRAGFGRDDFVASESHMPPLPSVPKEVPKEEGANHLNLPEVIVMGDGPVSEPLPSADQAPGGSTTAMAELRACEAQVELAANELHMTQQALKLAEVTPGQARAGLAQLEARLDRLQCHSIDAVSTAGLSSQDEEAARALRRLLVKQVEQLQGRLDETFERLKGQ